MSSCCDLLNSVAAACVCKTRDVSVPPNPTRLPSQEEVGGLHAGRHTSILIILMCFESHRVTTQLVSPEHFHGDEIELAGALHTDKLRSPLSVKQLQFTLTTPSHTSHTLLTSYRTNPSTLKYCCYYYFLFFMEECGGGTFRWSSVV